eukprot:1194440-Prorocentrum_minimum.AAC.1
MVNGGPSERDARGTATVPKQHCLRQTGWCYTALHSVTLKAKTLTWSLLRWVLRVLEQTFGARIEC